jgi:hypothetical protein
MTALYEGDTVSYVGTAMPPAHGKLLFFASQRAAHVKWADGVRQGEIDLIDIHDLSPVTAGAVIGEADPMGHTACVRALEAEGPPGVLNFLVASKQVENWPDIATDVLGYVEARIRADGSMDMPNEQLTHEDFDRVVRLASRVLLRDAFGELEDAP